jgi:pimeloyl-ACP methyl ester carboxylesterase
MPSIFNVLLFVFLLLHGVCIASKPDKSQSTVLFVPGAWHLPDIYDKVITILSAKGFSSRKINLASVGRSPPVSSIEPDVEIIRDTALSEMRRGHDVIVVCHSYGGLPTNQALKGLENPRNAGGGRVSAIVYIAAFLIREGITGIDAIDAQGGSPNSLELEFLSDGNVFFKNGTNPAEAFYSGLPAKEGRYWVSQLRPQSGVTYGIPATYAAWKDIPSWYLVTRKDKTLRPKVQRGWIEEAREYLDQIGGPGTGDRRLRSQEINTGHSPFLSRPRETADFIERASVACRD